MIIRIYNCYLPNLLRLPTETSNNHLRSSILDDRIKKRELEDVLGGQKGWGERGKGMGVETV